MQRVIIGIFGRTLEGPASTESDRQLLEDARAAGRRVSELEHVLLTGGSWYRPENSVKFAAIKGAYDASTLTKQARVIGILPTGISPHTHYSSTIPGVETESVEDGRLRVVHFHTLLKSKDRDPISGAAVDVAIALRGEQGTPREVVSALRAGRTVIYLRSWQKLEPLIRSELTRQELPESLIEGNVRQTDDPLEAVAMATSAALETLAEGRASTLRNGEALRQNLKSCFRRFPFNKRSTRSINCSHDGHAPRVRRPWPEDNRAALPRISIGLAGRHGCAVEQQFSQSSAINRYGPL